MKSTFIPLAIALSASVTHAANVVVGSDNANSTAYTSPPAWSNGTNGGTAGTFGAWSHTGTGSFFIESSTNLSSPGADINSNSKSFGIYAGSSANATATRNFSGNTLGVGQAFSLDLAVNFRNGSKGFTLRNAANTNLFNFNVENQGGAGDGYYVNNATTGNGTIGNTYSANTAFRLSFSQTSAGGGTWSITRSGGTSDLDTGTYTGIPENFFFYTQNADAGAANNLYFNNLTVVPEPSAALLGAIGSLILFRRRK